MPTASLRTRRTSSRRAAGACVRLPRTHGRCCGRRRAPRSRSRSSSAEMAAEATAEALPLSLSPSRHRGLDQRRSLLRAIIFFPPFSLSFLVDILKNTKKLVINPTWSLLFLFFSRSTKRRAKSRPLRLKKTSFIKRSRRGRSHACLSLRLERPRALTRVKLKIPVPKKSYLFFLVEVKSRYIQFFSFASSFSVVKASFSLRFGATDYRGGEGGRCSSPRVLWSALSLRAYARESGRRDLDISRFPLSERDIT